MLGIQGSCLVGEHSQSSASDPWSVLINKDRMVTARYRLQVWETDSGEIQGRLGRAETQEGSLRCEEAAGK